MIYERIENVPLPQYKKSKIRLLQDFGVYLTETQTQYLHSLPTEISVDNFCGMLRDAKLNEPIKEIKPYKRRKQK